MAESRRRKKSTPRRSNKIARKKWSSAWYVVIPAVLLLAITAPWQRTVRNFFAPYLLISEDAGSVVADSTLLMRSRAELAGEVTRLQLQNIQLIMELEETRHAVEENLQLRSIIKLQSPPGYDYTAANVILRDPWMWESSFTIDRGSNDGLQPGLAVIAPAPDRENRVILLGVIDSVSKRSSRVTTLLNPEFSISARLPESDAVGFLNAGESNAVSAGCATIGFLPSNSTFALNELLFTTGYEAGIPEGLLLGSLESIESSAMPYGNRLYRRGVMKPAGNFEELRTVVVARFKNYQTAGE